ncbi:DNA polymerase III subunit beta [Rhodocaloribacter litoris]|uniref:DNA polymerase III subunit beta n=1 Tax=Rhodocaloribacter litoris TaxID=2558931 RepID=UPI001423520C|nr:DNA polymerase III subunit beta [Rhodocaloribacter litoris]QXD13743.1 DNA polymerase III subunit beta [Rhodocaloribacter litoris]
MKFTASSADLLKALTTVSGAVPSKSTLPILECILFERDGDTLQLSATDLEISIVQRLAVPFESNGTTASNRIAVPARRLLDTLRALPDLPIRFSTDDDFNVTLRTDQGLYKMVGHDGADYPALPELSGNVRIETDGKLLRRAIQKTHFAVSKDALRPAMMGIYFQIGPEEGRAVATDGHRLVKLTLAEMTSPVPVSFIVPEKAMTLAARIATDEACTIIVDEGYAGFDFGEARVLARLIDETYPNYEAVIPVENDRLLVAGRDAMLAAVKRVGLYSSSMTNQIRLSLKADQVEISAEDIERASEARETVLCEYDGEEMVIGFNAQYLTEVLNNVDAEEVRFEFSSPNRAGVVTPREQHEGEDMMMLIMPVMLNTYA